MDLEPFLRQFRRDLTAAAHTDDDAVRAAAAHLAIALESSARLVLLDVLVSAADELTIAAGATVEVRLRGREVELVVDTSPEAEAVGPAEPTSAELDDLTARVSLRLPDSLKARAEQRADSAGVSLNTWLVRSVAAAVDDGVPRRAKGPGTRLSGWARS